MQIGYMRISKNNGSQKFDVQEDALLRAGVESDRIYKDDASGKNMNRFGLKSCLKSLRQDDILVIYERNRLSTDFTDLFGIIGDLRNKGVKLRILNSTELNIDPTTHFGYLIFVLLAAMNGFKTENLENKIQKELKKMYL